MYVYSYYIVQLNKASKFNLRVYLTIFVKCFNWIFSYFQLLDKIFCFVWFQTILQQSTLSVVMEVRPHFLVPDTNCYIDYLPQLQMISRAVSSTQQHLYTLMVPLVGKCCWNYFNLINVLTAVVMINYLYHSVLVKVVLTLYV